MKNRTLNGASQRCQLGKKALATKGKTRVKNRCTYMHVLTSKKDKDQREIVNLIQMLLS